MSVTEFIKTKKRTKKFAQVALSEEYFNQIKQALEEDGLTFQQVLEAGLASWLSERKRKKK